jgi:hypothetical protein
MHTHTHEHTHTHAHACTHAHHASYTEWFMWNVTTGSANFNKTVARELYNHIGDVGDDFDWAGEEINLADDPTHASDVAEGASIVREGWRACRPPTAP